MKKKLKKNLYGIGWENERIIILKWRLYLLIIEAVWEFLLIPKPESSRGKWT